MTETEQVTEQPDQADHLIWSYEHDAWWGPDHRGYTSEMIRAGLYTRTEAERAAAEANRYTNGERERAIPVARVASQVRELAQGVARLLAVVPLVAPPGWPVVLSEPVEPAAPPASASEVDHG